METWVCPEVACWSQPFGLTGRRNFDAVNNYIVNIVQTDFVGPELFVQEKKSWRSGRDGCFRVKGYSQSRVNDVRQRMIAAQLPVIAEVAAIQLQVVRLAAIRWRNVQYLYGDPQVVVWRGIDVPLAVLVRRIRIRVSGRKQKPKGIVVSGATYCQRSRRGKIIIIKNINQSLNQSITQIIQLTIACDS